MHGGCVDGLLATTGNNTGNKACGGSLADAISGAVGPGVDIFNHDHCSSGGGHNFASRLRRDQGCFKVVLDISKNKK